MSKRLIVSVISAILAFSMLTSLSADDSNGVSLGEDSVKMVLMDEDGKTLSKVSMSFSTVTLDSDVHSGILTYHLKCDSSLLSVPSFVSILADSGLYQVDLSIAGLQNTQYAQYGVRVSLDDFFFADLTIKNSFKSTLVDSDGKSAIVPGHVYGLSLYSIETGAFIPPGSLKNVQVTFSWFASEGNHIVMFVDENVDYGLVIVNPGESVKLLSPSGLKEFDCWMDQDDKVYEPGSTIFVNSDMVLYAAWGENNPLPTIIFSGIYIVILIVFFAVCGIYFGAYKH